MTVSGSYNGTPTAGNACTAASSGCTAAGGTANQVCCASDCTYGATQTQNAGITNGYQPQIRTCNATKNGTSGCYTWGGWSNNGGIMCSDGYYNVNGSCNKYETCSAGSFMWWWEGGGFANCESCHGGYYCPGGINIYGSGSTNVANAAGIIPIYSCPDGGSSNGGASVITDCYKQTAVSGGTQTCYYNGSSYSNCSIACNSGYHNEGGSCVSNTRSCINVGGISSGYEDWNGSGWGACRPESATWGCHWGYYNNNGASCESCPPGEWCYNSRNTCPAGYFCPGGNYDPAQSGDTYKCPDVPGNYYTGVGTVATSNPGAKSASDCYVGAAYRWEGHGAWAHIDGYTSSSPCYWDGGDYRTCTKKFFECQAGYSLSSTKEPGFENSCQPCAAGSYSPELTTFPMYNGGNTPPYNNNASCTLCGGGTYQDQTGQTSCKACPVGPDNGGRVSTYSPTGVFDSIYFCYHTNMTYTGTYCSGTRTCYYTSGSGSSAIYNGGQYYGCDNYNLTSCGAGGYAPITSLHDGEPVGSDYYSADGLVTRTACPSGTKSGGAGTGADSASDCVPYMSLRNSKSANAPILRKGVKGNSPRHLCVKNGNDVYYGNLVTDSVTGAVRLNIDGTTYYLTDNSTM